MSFPNDVVSSLCDWFKEKFGGIFRVCNGNKRCNGSVKKTTSNGQPSENLKPNNDNNTNQTTTGKIKTAYCGEYVISRNEKGSIRVCRNYDNAKGALREIAVKIGFRYDEGWNTRQFGKNLIEHITGEHVKTSDAADAESGEYVISKEASGTISVFKEYDNTKGALREIAGKIGFAYDNDWTTQQFGNKLIDKLNG